MREGDRLSQLKLRTVELMKSTDELKTTNLHLKELVEINTHRIEWIEHSWWKKLVGIKPVKWQ